MSSDNYVRRGTPQERAAAAAEAAGVEPEPLICLTFYGHLVHNPDQVGTLAPAFTGQTVDHHSGIPCAILPMLLPLLLEHLQSLFAEGLQIEGVHQ